MRRPISILILSVLLMFTVFLTSSGASIELAAGLWFETPYMGLDLNADQLVASYMSQLNIPSQYKSQVTATASTSVNSALQGGTLFEARAIIRTALPVIPNLYFYYSPISFVGSTTITTKINITSPFGVTNFTDTQTIVMNSTLTMLDIGLFWGMPFLETLTDGWLNIDLGLNIKTLIVPKNMLPSYVSLPLAVLPIPMLYVAAQVAPKSLQFIAFAAEVRMLPAAVLAAFTNQVGLSIYDYVGRVKVMPLNPFFLAAGWRYQAVSAGTKGINLLLNSSGPFLEAGIYF